jgi:hypothetical protein
MKLFLATRAFNTGYYGEFENFLIIRAVDLQQALSIAKMIKNFEYDNIEELNADGDIAVIYSSL